MELRTVLDDLAAQGAAYADLRWQTSERASIEWRDGEIRKAVAGAEEGYGVRVLVDGAWGLASANRADGLSQAAERALRLARAVAREERREPFVLAPVRPAKDRSEASPRVAITS